MKIMNMIIVCILTWYCPMSAMLKHVLPEPGIKTISYPSNEKYLERYGNDDASPIMQQRLKDVEGEYTKKGLELPENIMIKQMQPSAIADLKQSGSTTPNIVNNGIDTLHTTCNQVELTEQESKQLLAHELAHIILGKYKWLNPHWYMSKCTKARTLGIASLGVPGLLLYGLKSQKTQPFIAATIMAVYVLNALKWRKNSSMSLRPLPGIEDSVNYHHIGKLEEIECDIIAACIMPEGGKNGASLWHKKLDMYGNRNGINGSHPYYSTRIKYHKIIQWIQEKIA